MKKLLLVIISVFIILIVTGCNSNKESELVGLKYVDESEEEYITHWEFKEGNVLYSYSTSCGPCEYNHTCDKPCNGSEEEYFFEGDYLIIADGDNKSKYKVSSDKKTITSVAYSSVMTLE